MEQENEKKATRKITQIKSILKPIAPTPNLASISYTIILRTQLPQHVK